MCGIFGIVGVPTAVDSVDVGAALAALRHRGPDAEGVWRSPSGRCLLAHTRLAIIGLSDAGRQPMVRANGSRALTYNGEVYNYREVAAARGAPVPVTDTEVLLDVLDDGPEALRSLRGMFAFAHWDEGNGRVLLGRDRFGVKPLYWCRYRGAIAFASEVRALIAAGVAPKELAKEALDGYLATGSVQEPLTLVAGVRALHAGGFLTASVTHQLEEPRISSWYELPSRATFDSPEGIVPAVRAKLEEAVRSRLVADVPVGIFLSGGMDSSAIATIAARVSDRRVHTFTVGFPHASDERPAASAVAAALQTEHHEITLEDSTIRGEVEPALAAQDQPSVDGLNTFVVAAAVRGEGLSVALSGVGGDELFAGYDGFRRVRLAMLLGGLGRPLRALPSELLPESKLVLLATSGGSLEAVQAVFRTMFLEPQRRRLLRGTTDVTYPRPVVAHDLMGGMSVLELRTYLVNTLLRDTDAMGMAHALEIREPLLDHELVELMLSIPGHYKLAGQRRGGWRSKLRRTLAEFDPRSPTRNKPLLAAAVPEMPMGPEARRKSGFTLPIDAWLRTSLRTWAQKQLLVPEVLKPHLSQQEVWAVWYAFEASQVSFHRVWALLALCHWCRTQLQ